MVIVKKSDYVTKLDTMINDGIIKGTDFHDYKRYKDMKSDSNQPARLYGTTKTHKFETIEDITVVNLKFRPIIDQT